MVDKVDVLMGEEHEHEWVTSYVEENVREYPKPSDGALIRPPFGRYGDLFTDAGEISQRRPK